MLPESLANTTPYPLGLSISHAKGVWITDTDGNNYLDMIAGIAVNNIGHSNPKVVSAIEQQANKHLHVMVYGEFEQQAQTEFANLLTQQLPESLNSVYFTNSGAEGVEGALKLAKRYKGRHEMIAFKKSYHGSTHGALSVTGNENKKYAFRPLLPGVQFIDFNQEASLNQITDKTACVIVETIQGDAGVRIPSKPFLQALRQRCTETGALLIFDEIQAGMGRTGKLFAFQHFGVVPDILVLGKALGGGIPIGAFLSSKSVMNSLTHNPPLGHITTFGGHPLACAAGKASLELLLEEDWIETAEEKGKYLQTAIENHSLVKEVRRAGLMFAIELDSPERVQKVVEYCLKNRLLTFWFLSCPESFRLSPPLCITKEELDIAINIITESFDHALHV